MPTVEQGGNKGNTSFYPGAGSRGRVKGKGVGLGLDSSITNHQSPIAKSGAGGSRKNGGFQRKTEVRLAIAMKETSMEIRTATDSDLQDVLRIEREAFGYDKEAELVADMLGDPSAKPYLSLLAFADDKAVGHILFSAAHLVNTQDKVTMSILAPLAIVPDAQNKGVGGELIKEGLALLSKSNVDLVFVLGHPGYYPRYGFEPAGRLGLEAPYPIPEKDAGAWMVQALKPGLLGKVSGTLTCCDMLSKPQHWRE
jgi:putative acetyltransferase